VKSEKVSGQRSVFSYQRAGDGEIASSSFPFGKDFLAKTFTETALRRAQGERQSVYFQGNDMMLPLKHIAIGHKYVMPF